MSKFSAEQAIEPKGFEFLEAERDYLLSQEKITDEDVEYLFGSRRKYHLALIQRTHPRHNEAINVWNKRHNAQPIDPELERTSEEARVAHFAAIRYE